MSENISTEELREMFVDLRLFRSVGVPADYGAEFDEWLHFVRKEAHDEGYELCFADVGDDQEGFYAGYDAGVEDTEKRIVRMIGEYHS